MFYFSINKPVTEMTIEELRDERDSAVIIHERYSENGEGMSTKESIRWREAEEELIVATFVEATGYDRDEARELRSKFA